MEDDMAEFHSPIFLLRWLYSTFATRSFLANILGFFFLGVILDRGGSFVS